MLPSLNGGGAERAAVQIINGLDRDRWNRSMYLFRKEGPYVGELHPSVAVAAGSSASRIGRWLELRRFFRRARPDLVVSFLSYFSTLTAARSTGIHIRVVLNQQTPMSAFLADADYRWRGPIRRRLLALATRVGFGLADAIVTTSEGVAEDLIAAFGVARERVRVVHNPVDLERIRQAASERLEVQHERLWSHPVIVAAGRLADAKNYPLLIEALHIVRQRAAARLFILGEGEREIALRERVARLGLDEAVVFCGFQANPWKFMAKADVFALSSRYEGFGNVVVEAMACGVPVVATLSPGTREIVQSGVNGFLVDQHDPRAFAAAIERAIGPGPLGAQIVARAKQTAEQFGISAVASTYDRTLREVLA